jgi:hypothetical protein
MGFEESPFIFSVYALISSAARRCNYYVGAKCAGVRAVLFMVLNVMLGPVGFLVKCKTEVIET